MKKNHVFIILACLAIGVYLIAMHSQALDGLSRAEQIQNDENREVFQLADRIIGANGAIMINVKVVAFLVLLILGNSVYQLIVIRKQPNK